jgi:hypothetical protein
LLDLVEDRVGLLVLAAGRPGPLDGLEPGLVRPPSPVQLVTVLPTSSDTIEYVKEVSRENVAAPVAEATALTGASGTKPEGGIVFDVVTEPISTIAVWVPGTRRIVADAAELEANVHPKVASEALGHSSVAFTMDVYSYVLPVMQEEAARAIPAALGDGGRA